MAKEKRRKTRVNKLLLLFFGPGERDKEEGGREVVERGKEGGRVENKDVEKGKVVGRVERKDIKNGKEGMVYLE